MTDKPPDLIAAERAVVAAFDTHYKRRDGLRERINKGTAYCAANPGDLKAKRLLSALKVELARLDKAWLGLIDKDGEMHAALAEYERVSDQCGSYRWPLEEETHAAMDTWERSSEELVRREG